MIYKRILLFLIVSNLVFFFSCSPSKRLAYHMSQSEKILEEYPELKKNIKLDSLIKKDSILVSVNVNDSIELSVDTTKFNQSIDSIVWYQNKIDSLESLPIKKDSIIIHKYKEKITEKKQEVINSVLDNKRYEVYLPVTYKHGDSTSFDSLRLGLYFYKGKLYLTGYDNHKLEFDKTDYTVNVDRDFGLFAWLKDEKTLFLSALVFILLLLLLFVGKRR